MDVEYDGNASKTEISDSGLENDRTGIVFYEKSEEKGFKKRASFLFCDCEADHILIFHHYFWKKC